MAVNKVIYGEETLVDLTEDTVTADTMLVGSTAHGSNGETIEGNIKVISEGGELSVTDTVSGARKLENNNFTVLFPKEFILDEDGSIRFTVKTKKGYHAKEAVAGLRLEGKLTTQPETSFTPSTEDQTIPEHIWTTGVQTIKGDPNLLPENIVKDKTIFGVTGSYEEVINPNLIDTRDATATSNDILEGKTAYVNGTKVKGSLQIQSFFAESSDPDISRMSEGDLWFVTEGE